MTAWNGCAKSAARWPLSATTTRITMGRRLRERERVSGRQYYRTERVLVPVETKDAAAEIAESCVLREEPPTK